MSRYRTRLPERILRRLLLLPNEAPDPSPYVVDPGESGFSTLCRRDQAEYQLAWRAWHEEGWRGSLAENLSRAHLVLRDWLSDVRGMLELMYVAHILAHARRLRFTSHYILEVETTSVEGYFDFGGNIVFPLTILAPSAMKSYSDFEWEGGGVVTSKSTLIFGREDWVVAPTDELSDEVVRETILRWYKERFEWKRGHWSQRDGFLPDLIIDLHWETEAERAKRLHEWGEDDDLEPQNS
jgi:hypothetical protein